MGSAAFADADLLNPWEFSERCLVLFLLPTRLPPWIVSERVLCLCQCLPAHTFAHAALAPRLPTPAPAAERPEPPASASPVTIGLVLDWFWIGRMHTGDSRAPRPYRAGSLRAVNLA